MKKLIVLLKKALGLLLIVFFILFSSNTINAGTSRNICPPKFVVRNVLNGDTLCCATQDQPDLLAACKIANAGEDCLVARITSPTVDSLRTVCRYSYTNPKTGLVRTFSEDLSIPMNSDKSGITQSASCPINTCDKGGAHILTDACATIGETYGVVRCCYDPIKADGSTTQEFGQAICSFDCLAVASCKEKLVKALKTTSASAKCGETGYSAPGCLCYFEKPVLDANGKPTGNYTPDTTKVAECTKCILTDQGMYIDGSCIGIQADTFVNSIIQIMTGILGGFLIFKIILIGWTLQNDSDKPDKLAEAKQELWAVITAIIFLAVGILGLGYIGVDVLGLGKYIPDWFKTATGIKI